MNILFVGAGGAGVGALVRWHGELGNSVFMQDDAVSPDELLKKYPKAELFDANAGVLFGCAVFSDAIPAGHFLRTYAHEKNIPARSYAEELGALCEGRHVIAVAGTHGKSTTTALVSWALASAGREPLCVIGAEIKEWHGGFRFGEGPVVVEADEYRKHFLHLRPTVVVVTSLEMDHFDTYADEAELVRTFVEFGGQASVQAVLVARGHGNAVMPALDRLSDELVTKGKEVIRFGGAHDSVRCVVAAIADLRCRVTVAFDGESHDFEVSPVACAHVSNLLATITALAHERVSIEQLQKGVDSFPGILRRLELLGTVGDGVPLYSDYAHHPTAVRETLRALRRMFPERRIAVIFEPHERLRTSALREEYRQAFAHADAVGLLPIYDPVGRERPDISDAAAAISLPGDFTPLPDYAAAFAWAEKFAEKVEPTHSHIRTNVSGEEKRLIVIMGAGPIDGAFRKFVSDCSSVQSLIPKSAQSAR